MEKEDKGEKSEMVAIAIEEFLSASKLPVDIYVRLSEEKYIQLAKAGETVPTDRLESYSEKKIKELYVKKDEYSRYLEQHLNIAGIIIKKQEIHGARKSTITSQAAKAVFKEMEGAGISSEAFHHAQEVTKVTIGLVESQTSLAELMEGLNSCSDLLVAHSIAVSAVSVMIARHLEWTQKGTIEKLALGGLLHDIGKKELPKELFSKQRSEMSFEDVQLYESHSQRGLQILTSLRIVPEDILAIVHEHHETAFGQGYPRKLRLRQMHPLAQVVGLANSYCDLTLPHPLNPSARAPAEAIYHIETTLGQPYSLEHFNALKKLLGLYKKGTKKAG